MRQAHFLFVVACATSVAAQDSPPEIPAGVADRSVIIVTGERVARSARNTASSVALFNSRQIERSSAYRVEDILRDVPNVQLGQGSQGPAIRGQDTTGALSALPAFLGGNRPRTTVVVDGRRQTYNEFLFGSSGLWDIDRIEVFRSPQTTTQGQNSIAGAIFLHSEDPTADWESRFRLLGGNLRTREVAGVVSGPLSNDVSFRIAGDLRRSRPSSHIADVMVGASPNRNDQDLVRAKVRIAPARLPGTRLTLILAHNRSIAPQIVGVKAPFKARRDKNPNYGVFEVRADSLTALLTQEIGQSLTATITATAGDTMAERFATVGFGQARNKGRDWSAEGLISWTPGADLRAIAGLSTTQVRLRQRIDLSVLSGIGRFRDLQRSLGIFGEVEFSPLPRVTLTTGLRYQRDRQRRAGALQTRFVPIALDYDRTFDALLPKVSLAYDLTPGLRVGLLAQRAFNPGGTTLRFDTGRPDEFDAETLWDFEGFVRASSRDQQWRFSANLFRYDMRNAQRSRTITILAPNGRFVSFADLYNVPRARSQGVEAELRWRASSRFDARLALGLLDTRVLDGGPDNRDLDGKQFERSPRFSASVALDWSPIDRLTLSATARHSSGYFSDDRENPVLRVPAATSLDARVEWRQQRFTGFAYARNIFDDFQLTYLFSSTSGEAAGPREIGAGLQMEF